MKVSSSSLFLGLLLGQLTFNIAATNYELTGKEEKPSLISKNSGVSVKVSGVSNDLIQEDFVQSQQIRSLVGNAPRSRPKRNFVVTTKGWWDPRAIPYKLDKSLGSSTRKAFQAAIDLFEKNTCIRFKKRTDEEDYIWVSHGKGCYSTIGKAGGIQRVSLGEGCHRKAIIIHELAHSLGMMHEHCRPDRDQFIRINYDNVKPKEKKEYDILRGNTVDEPYDFGSVMHYGSTFFAIDRKKPTIVKLMPGGQMIGQRKRLSDVDLRKINKFYGCTNYIKALPPPKKEEVKLVSGDCNFESTSGLCNWKNWKNDFEDQFDWLIGTEAESKFGPVRDHTQSEAKGKFIFFTSPSSKRQYMSSGVLSSGFIRGSSCLTFHYHMANGGYLRVFTKEAQSTKKNPYVLIWEKEGLQDNKWISIQKTILGTPNPYQIFLEGVKTPGLNGVVAVDDVFVSQGKTCVGEGSGQTRR